MAEYPPYGEFINNLNDLTDEKRKSLEDLIKDIFDNRIENDERVRYFYVSCDIVRTLSNQLMQMPEYSYVEYCSAWYPTGYYDDTGLKWATRISAGYSGIKNIRRGNKIPKKIYRFVSENLAEPKRIYRYKNGKLCLVWEKE